MKPTSPRAGEAAQWYFDHEGIAKKKTSWLRRHVGCGRGRIKGAPRAGEFESDLIVQTCEAVERAMKWFWAAAEPGAEDAPPNAFYVKAQFSLLAPGAHVRPHTGPTNERLVISLGIAGVGHDNARIRVTSQWRPWRAGEAIVWDDSFEHEVVVDGEPESAPPRAIVIVHFEHPDLVAQRFPRSNAARIAEAQRRGEVCDLSDV